MQLRSRQRLGLLVLAGAALVTSACGPSPGPPPETAPPPDTASPASPAPSGPRVSRVLTWLRMGPTGEGTPLWYDPLKDGDCGDEQLLASRAQPVPRAGALLCEAATTNNPEL